MGTATTRTTCNWRGGDGSWLIKILLIRGRERKNIRGFKIDAGDFGGAGIIFHCVSAIWIEFSCFRNDCFFFVLSIISVGLVCESCDVKMVSVQLYMYIDL